MKAGRTELINQASLSVGSGMVSFPSGGRKTGAEGTRLPSSLISLNPDQFACPSCSRTHINPYTHPCVKRDCDGKALNIYIQ